MSELEQLRDRVAELEEALGLTATLPAMFRLGLPRLEEKLLGLLLARPFIAKEAAYIVLWGARLECEQPSFKNLDVYISRLRAVLRRRDITIKTKYGDGWYIEAADKARLRALLTPEQAA